jgi:hypothetical protein
MAVPPQRGINGPGREPITTFGELTLGGVYHQHGVSHARATTA